MRSIHEDGTSEKPSGSNIGSAEYPTDAAFFFGDFAILETVVVIAAQVHATESEDEPEETATTGVATFPFESPETSEDASASGSGNAGEKEILSAAYPENDVVRASGTADNQDEAVRREAVERFLIRNSEDVDESIRKDVFTSVAPLNHNRRTDHDIVAVEKNPVAVATLAA
ncbi:MAG: hypothetical protein WA194_02085 [Patescibacteria group bacterium]